MLKPTDFQAALLDWYDLSGRHDLPWQKVSTPYTVWLSEIMLQQTQVNTVIPYFLKFIQRFPTLESLAAAPAQDVMQHWAGLGYYARARNLHKTAQILVQAFQGQFPQTLEQMMSLPGIGRSTAGAILSFCFAHPHPILDGNVRRVLARYAGIYGYTGDPKIQTQLWALASHYTPTLRVGEYTQAMMDLGATLCTRSQPACTRCPVHPSCYAHQHQKTQALPTPKPSKVRPLREAYFLFFISQDQIALQHRASQSQGLWNGLFAPLWFDSEPDMLAYLHTHHISATPHHHSEQSHGFTHFQLVFIPVTLNIHPQNQLPPTPGLAWHPLKNLSQLGLPAPIQKWLAKLHP